MPSSEHSQSQHSHLTHLILHHPLHLKMSQSTCHIGFSSYTHPLFPTNRTLFLSGSPVFEDSGWCSTATETANGRGTCWVRSTSVQQTSTLWRSSRVSTTSFRSMHTWPTLQPSWPGRVSSRNETAHRCAASTTSSGARTNASFSRPCASRREVILGFPAWGGGARPTSFGDATLICSTRGAPQGVTVISLQNSNGSFGRPMH
ncbi:hypothetical protein EDB92DRAFT_1387702 [Lactarius akahatsu]|uniref:Uncharacterized protein n=1 Tax=Lactarius akahatsu TaxID=416441 RepID=A0AAD4L614_9AGAM|nr:hypothetical protein EDB92DRAFT_173081 [Lactarius akahatsu]KAH8985079.1 hypothetical protein EDB92DRAFT_1387702 [Lactarius akahatsu]